MVANFSLLLAAAVLIACGVFLLLERAITKMLLGLLLMGNGANLLMLTAGGGAGAPPIKGRDTSLTAVDADPLAQAMILTAIVISMAMTAFILALAYRQYQYRTADILQDDTEDTVVAKRPATASAAPDHDRSDDPDTGRPTLIGDAFGPNSFEKPVQEDRDA
ncbi:Na(+)/H(+) antiporter subunit C [Corynebacterium kalinowskii]|uniref:Na(+)/H(+) antiporter subunit C n=1 Tax=Corynebacterium kalinowskii TaxID=2675216 RepID=A0A6B8VAD6_9CORY|nr:Na(+)/H(+) antiporter subunit C [Corynebacterium kalinowskii]QGU01233.1 Na(+)/H(+) antiporter subunit C [Corynebacterium kalinowskii]